MSQNPTPGSHSKTNPPGPLPTVRKPEVKWPAVSQARDTPTSRPLEKSEKKTERNGDGVRSEEAKRSRREEDPKRPLDGQAADAGKLKREEEMLKGKCKQKDDRIAELEREIEKMRGSHQKAVEEHTQQIRTMEEKMKGDEELLKTRSAELSGAQTFLSTTDRLSEVEVLNIVRDLNENIYQVAVNLTEEWEKLNPPKATGRVDPGPRAPVSVLARLARNRDPTALTFLLQSRLCSRAVDMTLSWFRRKELAILVSIYRNLSTSKGQAISARWRSLTHSHLPPSPPPTALLVNELADILGITGLFPSHQKRVEFVQAVALEGIETIIRLCLRLELAFMVEVISSNMYLLVAAPDTVFEDARMTNEFGSDGASTPGGQGKVVGTTEVGVGKRMYGGPGNDRREEILLKIKVVLEQDVVGSRKMESCGGGGGGDSEKASKRTETDKHIR